MQPNLNPQDNTSPTGQGQDTAIPTDPKAPFISPELESELKDAIGNYSFEVEKEFSKILEEMGKDTNFTPDIKQRMLARITEDLYNAIYLEMISRFTDQDQQRLIKAIETGLTEYQQQQLFLKLYEQKTGHTLEEFAALTLERILRQFVNEYKVLKQSAKDVAGLTDEQCDEISQMIDDGKWEEAMKRVGV